MNCLLIFDEYIDQEKAREGLSGSNISRVFLYPYTSKWRLINSFKSMCENSLKLSVEVMNSAGLIDAEVERLPRKLTNWSHYIGRYNVKKRSLKAWMSMGEGEMSAWWFSPLSEKNPQKTDVYFDIARLNAIDKILSTGKYDICYISLNKRSVLKALTGNCARHEVKLLYWGRGKRKRSIKGNIKDFIYRESAFGYMCRTIRCARSYLARYISVRLAAKAFALKKKACRKGSSLVVSYFPFVDKEMAGKGILKNRYAQKLQDKFDSLGMDIIWLWIYVPLEGYTFKDALSLTNRYSAKGYANFLLDEFMSIKGFCSVACHMLRQAIVFAWISKDVLRAGLSGGFFPREADILLKDLFYDSFLGPSAYEGIMYYEAFKRVFRQFPDARHCVYYSEMHAWEKALVRGKNMSAPGIKAIGFQHSIISDRYFQYYYHKEELESQGDHLSLPLADTYACNGDIPCEFLKNIGYPDVRKVEAVRHMYIKDILDAPKERDKRPALLIAGSIHEDETEGLISIVREAYDDTVDMDLWIKGHPSKPVDDIAWRVFEGSAIKFYVKRNSIDKLVRQSRITIVGVSSVGLEALAAGSRVITPVLPDFMFLSPLSMEKELVTKVYTPLDLKKAIELSCLKPAGDKNIKEFIIKYWCLESELKRWQEVLK